MSYKRDMDGNLLFCKLLQRGMLKYEEKVNTVVSQHCGIILYRFESLWKFNCEFFKKKKEEQNCKRFFDLTFIISIKLLHPFCAPEVDKKAWKTMQWEKVHKRSTIEKWLAFNLTDVTWCKNVCLLNPLVSWLEV